MSNKKTFVKIGLIGCLVGCLMVGGLGFVAVRWLGNAALLPQNAPSAISSNPITAMKQAIEQKANDTMKQASSQVAAKAIEQITGEKIDPQQIAAIQKALQSDSDPAVLASQLLGGISGTHMLSGTLGLTNTLKPEDSAALLGQLAKLISGTQGISGTSGLLDLGVITDLLGADGLAEIGSMLGEDGPRPTAKATAISSNSNGGVAPSTVITASGLPIGLEQGSMTLRLPGGKIIQLKAVCAPPKLGAWYEMRANTGVPIDHPNYAMVSFAGNVTTLVEPTPMVMTIVLGANGSTFSGLNPDVKLALLQNGATSFTNLSLINTAPNSPDFKFNQPQRFSGEWQCASAN
ncbi:MAG: hypothetical protein WCL57_07520 [Chloroflexota bacterium]|nr:hypothetical protein [Chloroflexota bacterium]